MTARWVPLAVVIAAACCCGCDDRPQRAGVAKESQVGQPSAEGLAVEAAAPEPDATWHVVPSADGGFVVRWRSLPDSIPTLEPFSLEVELYRDESLSEPLASGGLGVDAGMPHHGHGMNVAPRITALGQGRYRVDAMLFHMGGRWELVFDHLDELGSERAQTTVVLP